MPMPECSRGPSGDAAYARIFHRCGVRVTVNTRLLAVRRSGNELVAVLGSDYGGGRLLAVRRSGNELVAVLGSDYGGGTEERRVDHVVVEHGTLPLDDLYFALCPDSSNVGEVDHGALLQGRPQAVVRNPAGTFQLFRIGDAVASRNIHAAVFDALRLAKDL